MILFILFQLLINQTYSLHVKSSQIFKHKSVELIQFGFEEGGQMSMNISSLMGLWI